LYFIPYRYEFISARCACRLGANFRMIATNHRTLRNQPLWLAYVLHRLSGISLALFLPLHFWVLSMSVTDPTKIDGLLYMNPSAIKTLAEVGLVFLLAVHMFGGLRLLALEWLPWSGPAGLFAALHAQQSAPATTKITLAVKGLIGKCGCTRMVQGGYNVALGGGDSVERHFMDTIIGGKWLPNQDMAWRLCKQAVERIHELENEIGCFFDRNDDGTLHQKAFAGQTADRTVHKGDLTGIEIINRLMEKVLASGVEKLQEHRAIGLIPTKDSAAIAGVLIRFVSRQPYSHDRHCT